MASEELRVKVRAHLQQARHPLTATDLELTSFSSQNSSSLVS